MLRHMGPRWVVLLAVCLWTAISVYMLVVLGTELDMDAVFPGFTSDAGQVIIRQPTRSTPSNPPAAVMYAFVAIGVLVASPMAFPQRMFPIALLVSTIVVACCLIATILRLGVLLVPILVLQGLALRRSGLETRRS